MSEKEKRIIAIDFGEARIGVAISDETGTIAVPLEVIKSKETDPFGEIRKIVEKYRVWKILLGFPILLSGKEGKVAKAVLEFKKRLEKEVAIPVELIDERFTTKIAKELLREKGERPRLKKEKIDLHAACWLLQEYLNRKKNETSP